MQNGVKYLLCILRLKELEMKLYLYGHDYKYAVEQMLLTLYPDE